MTEKEDDKLQLDPVGHMTLVLYPGMTQILTQLAATEGKTVGQYVRDVLIRQIEEKVAFQRPTHPLLM